MCPSPTETSNSHKPKQNETETASVGQTTMVSPSFCEMPIGRISDRSNSVTKSECLPSNSSPSIYNREDQRPESSNSVVQFEISKPDNTPRALLDEWQQRSTQEAKSLEYALSSQLNALTQASEKILAQLSAVKS